MLNCCKTQQHLDVSNKLNNKEEYWGQSHLLPSERSTNRAGGWDEMNCSNNNNDKSNLLLQSRPKEKRQTTRYLHLTKCTTAWIHWCSWYFKLNAIMCINEDVTAVRISAALTGCFGTFLNSLCSIRKSLTLDSLPVTCSCIRYKDGKLFPPDLSCLSINTLLVEVVRNVTKRSWRVTVTSGLHPHWPLPVCMILPSEVEPIIMSCESI